MEHGDGRRAVWCESLSRCWCGRAMWAEHAAPLLEFLFALLKQLNVLISESPLNSRQGCFRTSGSLRHNLSFLEDPYSGFDSQMSHTMAGVAKQSISDDPATYGITTLPLLRCKTSSETQQNSRCFQLKNPGKPICVWCKV